MSLIVVHSANDFDRLSRLLTPTKEEVNVFAGVRLSVCLSVSKVTQKMRVRIWMKCCMSTDVGTWTN